MLLSLLGKAHGSLARAGKVRGQTPKVCACGWSMRVHFLQNLVSFQSVCVVCRKRSVLS